MSRLSTIIPGISLTSAASSSAGQYAPPRVTIPTSAPQGDEESVVVRENAIETSGIPVGRLRSTDEDTGTLVAKDAIVKEVAAIARKQTEVEAQNPPGTSVSTKQLVTEATNREHVANARINDTSRSLEKLQRSCNHKYDRSSRRCLFCSKHRDSHVYDVGSKSILNQ